MFVRPVILALSLALTMAPARASDIEGSRDSALVSRYAGSSIVYFKSSEFDEVALLQAPHDYGTLLDRNDTRDRTGPEWLTLQGRVTEIRYEIPTGRSSLEVFANYEKALTGSGFSLVFKCADRACLTGSFKDIYVLGEQLDPANNLSTAYFDHARYLLARIESPERKAHVAVVVGESNTGTVAFVRVVEDKSVETGLVSVPKPEQLAAALQAGGKVDIYGILFDFDQASIKPDSKQTLDSIAKLMADKPNLKLEIVGHTDGKGTEAHNLDLSKRRAASVVAALVGSYKIRADRLRSRGAGMSEPVASNDTEEGRAKNRRVELKAR